MSTPLRWKHLGPNPQSCYKQLFIKGTRIRARVLYGMFMSADEPMTPEEIAADMSLSLDAVKEAIAYCQSNPAEIQHDLKREEMLLAASGMNHPGYRDGGRFKIVAPVEVVRIMNALE